MDNHGPTDAYLEAVIEERDQLRADLLICQDAIEANDVEMAEQEQGIGELHKALDDLLKDLEWRATWDSDANVAAPVPDVYLRACDVRDKHDQSTEARGGDDAS